jgi:surface antigen
MRILPLLVVVPLTLSMAACSGGNDSRINNTDLGTGTGMVLGGIVGSQFGKGNGRIVGTVAGVVAGGMIGNTIGRRLDQRDRLLAQEAEYDALERGETGRPRRWSNPDSSHYGDIVPAAPYQRGGLDCRDYAHTVYIDGRPETMRGTACRNRDGTWSAV